MRKTLACAGGYINCANFHPVQTYVVETASVSLVGRRHEAHRGHLVDAGSIPAPHSTSHGEGVQFNGCAQIGVETPADGLPRWEFSAGAMVVARAGIPAPPIIKTNDGRKTKQVGTRPTKQGNSAMGVSRSHETMPFDTTANNHMVRALSAQVPH